MILPIKASLTFAICTARHSFSATLCIGAVAVVTTSTQAQDLYVAQNLFAQGTGSILKYTPGGVQSTFASGLLNTYGLAFNNTGDLFVGEANGNIGGHIYRFTPAGSKSTFNSTVIQPQGLAFDSAGNLFVADYGQFSGGSIYKFTPGGSAKHVCLGE